MSNIPKYNKENVPFTEEEPRFDIKEWLFHFFKYWYLFLIGVVIALGMAYVKNRSWLPQVQTAGTMIIESRGLSESGSQAIMQGFGIQSGYRNMNNQVIMLRSYDLLTRVVDSLPLLYVDYINKGPFKTRNLYKNTPFYISIDYVSQEAYRYMFKISVWPDNSFTIAIDNNKNENYDFSIDGVFGEKIQNDMFSMTVHNLREFTKENEFYFRFRSKESLVNEFYGRLDFSFVMDNSSVLKVSLVGDTPERDIDFINKLCDIFISDNLNLKNKAAIKTISFIDNQLDILSRSLSVSEGEMTNFRQRNQIVNVSSYTGGILSKASLYDNKKRELELRETYLNDLVSYLNKNVATGSVIAPSSLGLNEPMLMQLVQQINTKFAELSELSEKNPYYEKLLKDIEITKDAIFEVVSSMRLSLNIEKDEVNKRLEELSVEMKNLPKKELEMIAIERRYRVDDTYYTFFLQKRAEAEIQKASNSPDNFILDKARALNVTNSNTKKNTTVLYLIIGLFIPFVIVLLFKLLNVKISSNSDVEKVSEFPVISSIRRTKIKDPMLSIKNPRSSFAETFRIIRTRIEFVVQRKTNIMITVTSAESNDGKTYFSANLAAIYAMTQRKTLLVDMDIRKPNMHELFDYSNDLGVTNYLIGEQPLLNVIKKTEHEYYDLLTAGTVPPNPGEIVRSDKLKEMLNELKKHYEYIIIDTSPIGLVADAYPIALMSDINLFIVRMNKTNRNTIKKLTTQLKEDKLPNLYVVVNDVPIEKARYSIYNSYGYGYTYGEKVSKKKREKIANHRKYYTDETDLK